MVNHILKEEYLGTHKESKVYYNIYMYILQTLIRIIKKEFPTIVLIKTLFKKMSTQIIKNNKEFIIINQLKNSSHFVTQKYTNEYKKRVKIPYYYKDSKGTFKKDNNTIYFLTHKNEWNKSKNSIALLPNFIHHLDSRIMIKVILQAKKENIPILPVHDCFYTLPKYYLKIKIIYINAFIEIIYIDKPIKHFIEINEINIEKIFTKNDQKIIKNWQNPDINFIERIKNSKYIIC